MPTIVTPTEIEEACFDGQLVAEAPDRLPGTVKGSDAEADRNEWPAVTLGRPQCWNLVELVAARGEELPAEMRLLLERSEFHLLQVACSFRPKHNAVVDWARFEVALRLAGDEAEPIAFDLFPRQVTHRADRDVELNISPSLKFAGVEAGLGSVKADIAVPKVEPSVIAYGLMEPVPAWDYTAHPQAPLVGSRFGYIIVQAPRGGGTLTTDLSLAASVTGSRGRFRAGLQTESGSSLSIVACSG